MSLTSALIAELQHEAATTRKVLERIPEEKFDWKPHEKSMSMQQLATHVAEMFGWITTTIKTSELDFAAGYKEPVVPTTNQELMEHFEKQIGEATQALESFSDESMMDNWTLKNGEQTYFTMPKAAVLRSFCFNHVVHHRGQLTVYLRLNDIPVPEIYGPSADEGTM